MAINKQFGLGALTRTMVLLLFASPISYGGSTLSQIRSVAVSPDGKLIAIDFGRGKTSFIYRIAVDTGSATRLTNAKNWK